MEYAKLGNTDIEVSELCVGCMSFGKSGTLHDWTLDESGTEEIVKHALDLGINFFDTAMGYQGGTSEEYLGRIIKECANREDVVIATKFVPRTESEIKNNISGQQHVENCLDASLKRLQMDYVDLYVYHFWLVTIGWSFNLAVYRPGQKTGRNGGVLSTPEFHPLPDRFYCRWCPR